MAIKPSSFDGAGTNFSELGESDDITYIDPEFGTVISSDGELDGIDIDYDTSGIIGTPGTDFIFSKSDEINESGNLIHGFDGFDDIRITNYFFSKNTFQSFTNFNFQIPNENLKIKIDGNYVIKIYDENYNEVLERKIIILNNPTNGLVNITIKKIDIKIFKF